MSRIILIIHNIRSSHNVGSMLRSADAFGVEKVIVSGYSPYPSLDNDSRLPHIKSKLTAQIAKSALGAERTMNIERSEDLNGSIISLKHDGFIIAGIEQDKRSLMLSSFSSNRDIALIVGEEVNGMAPAIREVCDALLEIPMLGTKESLNVSVATGITLYHLRYPQ